MRAVVGLLIAAALAVAGCSSSAGTATDQNPNVTPDSVKIVYPQAAFTAKTVSDWKSLGDAIVIAEITSSSADTSPAGNPDNNGGVYGRVVTVQVLNTLWSRDELHVPPATFDMKAWGWVLRGNAKQAIVARGEPRLETNHIYLLVLAKFSTGWAGLGDGAEVPFDDGTIGYGEWAGEDPADNQPALADLKGKDLTGVQQVIDSSQPDTRSLQYSDLDPLARAKKLGKASG